MVRSSFMLLVLLMVPLCGITQIDSLSAITADSLVTQVASKKLSKTEKRQIRVGDRKVSPKKAVLLSLGLPGAGQVYNRRYWKLPIVYGALGTMTYFVIINTQDLKRFRRAYLYRTDDNPDTVDEFEGIYTATDIQSLRNSAQSNVETSYIGLFLAYALTGVDAFVDAHLHSFDINDDLSLDIGPEFMLTTDQTPAFGVGLQLRNRTRSGKTPYSLF